MAAAASGSSSPLPEEHCTCADKHAVDHKLTPECAERCGVRDSNRCWVLVYTVYPLC